eukprot:3844273-Prymnesium_polylepis.3
MARQELNEVTEDKLCAVCLVDEKNILFEPCGHITVCEGCAFQVDKCPLCRTVPTKRAKVYF